jgi:hypothetical protein
VIRKKKLCNQVCSIQWVVAVHELECHVLSIINFIQQPETWFKIHQHLIGMSLLNASAVNCLVAFWFPLIYNIYRKKYAHDTCCLLSKGGNILNVLREGFHKTAEPPC